MELIDVYKYLTHSPSKQQGSLPFLQSESLQEVVQFISGYKSDLRPTTQTTMACPGYLISVAK